MASNASKIQGLPADAALARYVEAALAACECTIEDFNSKRRHPRLVRAREIVVYVAHQRLFMSCHAIGVALGRSVWFGYDAYGRAQQHLLMVEPDFVRCYELAARAISSQEADTRSTTHAGA
jgi:hypothetical protein